MLAQNFKTAEELGIKDVEFDALRNVLGMLERGEILAPPPNARIVNSDGSLATLKFFDMESAVHDLDCGTAGCLLGWAWRVAGDTNRIFHDGGFSIIPLFLPQGPARYTRNPGVAAIALRNYLTHGEPRWAEALAA